MFNDGNLESIEPKEKFKPTKILLVSVRTFIHMFVANGRPVFRRVDKTGKPTGSPTFNCRGDCLVVQGVKIISNDGQRDLTELIKTHEKRHVDDTFSAWKEQIIDKVKAQLNDSSLSPSVVSKTVRIEITPLGMGQNAVDVIGTYLLSESVTVTDFKKNLDALLSKSIIDGFKQNFKVEKDNKSSTFHNTPEGMGLTGEEGVTVDGKPLDPVNGTVQDPSKPR